MRIVYRLTQLDVGRETLCMYVCIHIMRVYTHTLYSVFLPPSPPLSPLCWVLFVRFPRHIDSRLSRESRNDSFQLRSLLAASRFSFWYYGAGWMFGKLRENRGERNYRWSDWRAGGRMEVYDGLGVKYREANSRVELQRFLEISITIISNFDIYIKNNYVCFYKR